VEIAVEIAAEIAVAEVAIAGAAKPPKL